MKIRAHVALGSLMSGLLLVASLVGCKSTGEGMGESRTGDVKVSFMWEQSGPPSGMLKASAYANSRPDKIQAEFPPS
jgi:hypothetical protein